ncbi:engulfment and cell motility protein 1-like isoform X2 [Varroa jacobsoni]|uniref:ELMO domain-containing protein n=1 Tax=Varroa destructor TaxID=109461 RepID=A0A7M7J368_VARDE|nr:engulfment and cell motility protein 1-like isoform X2 [Varroa destructor]XP_022646154.1 engulfment and cell motility protein 1-like isoform X2 [Varroa destructor]XP_022686749.1 engulfment and cell motility protein 1-like isoform X2 [Varroa jacobsoni]
MMSFKVRVKVPHRPEFDKLFYMVQPDLPIKTQVLPICQRIDVEPAEYRFAYEEDGKLFYLTEQNRDILKEGNTVVLMRSPTLLAQTAKNDLESFNKAKALESLKLLIHCPKFAERFVAVEGIDSLVKVIAGGHFNGPQMHKALRIIKVFLSVCPLNVNHFTLEFVKRLCAELAPLSQYRGNFDVTLSVLGHMARVMPSDVFDHLPVSRIVENIAYGNTSTPRYFIILMNNLMDCLDTEHCQKLIADILNVSENLSEKLLHCFPKGSTENDMTFRQQLFQFQTKLLRNKYGPLYNQRGEMSHNNEFNSFMETVLRTHLGWRDPQSRRYIDALKRIGGVPEEYEDVLRPGEKFLITVRDIDGLTLHCLKYFEQKYSMVLYPWMKEISIVPLEYICPLLKSAILLSDLIVDMLSLEDAPAEGNKAFLRMFFTDLTCFLEEFFCLTLKLVLKTWREMRAVSGDLLKVFAIVREQLAFALDDEMATWSFDQLQLTLNAAPYPVISQRLEVKQLTSEDVKRQELLTSQLKDKIWSLVRESKIAKLIEGLDFSRVSDRGSRMKNKVVTVRLSHDRHQVRVIIDHQTLALPLESLLRVDTMKQCIHYRKDDFALTIMSTQTAPVHVATTDPEVFEDLWDAINGLIGVSLESKSALADFKELMDLELKLATLELEVCRHWILPYTG